MLRMLKTLDASCIFKVWALLASSCSHYVLERYKDNKSTPMPTCDEKEKGKVNQLDVRNEKEQQNSGSNNPKTSINSKSKSKWPAFRASDKIHSTQFATSSKLNLFV